MLVTIYNLTSGPLTVRNPYTGTLAALGSAGSSKAIANVSGGALVGNAELQDLLSNGKIQVLVQPDTTAVADPRLVSPDANSWLSFANQAGAAIGQYNIVRGVDATSLGLAITQGCVLAEADTAPHALGVLGAVQNTPAAATDITGLCRVAMTGDVGFATFDLGGGHIEPVAGSLCYLSQTRLGYAQADLPGSGTIKSLGTVITNGVVKVGDATTGLALVSFNV